MLTSEGIQRQELECKHRQGNATVIHGKGMCILRKNLPFAIYVSLTLTNIILDDFTTDICRKAVNINCQRVHVII